MNCILYFNMEYVEEIKDLLKDLSSNVDELKSVMEPVLQNELSEQLVCLDSSLKEAKLCTLLAYSLDSIIFGMFT